MNINCRLLLVACLSLLFTGCVSFSDENWRSYVQLKEGIEYARCKGTETNIPEQSQKRLYYLVTSRLPDCRDKTDDPQIHLSIQRGDRIRFGQFSAPITEKDQPPLAFVVQDQWWNALSRDLCNAPKDKPCALATDGSIVQDKVLIYVHGFNNSFSRTASVTDKIAQRTGFKGPVVHFSWPSHQSVTRYVVDDANNAWNQAYFDRVIWKIAGNKHVSEIILVAHSMGSRSAFNAVKYMDSRHPNISNKIKTIILASPDLDRATFEQGVRDVVLTENHIKHGRRITVYTSKRDGANWASKRIHGYARLGLAQCIDPNEILTSDKMSKGTVNSADGASRPTTCYPQIKGKDDGPIDGLDIVDTTKVRASFIGHGDYIDSSAGCADLARVINQEIDNSGARKQVFVGRIPLKNIWHLEPIAPKRCNHSQETTE